MTTLFKLVPPIVHQVPQLRPGAGPHQVLVVHHGASAGAHANFLPFVLVFQFCAGVSVGIGQEFEHLCLHIIEKVKL